FGLVLDGGAQRGFFSSDRFNGKGAEDIYSFSEEESLEISLENDTLLFRDNSIYDDIRFKLVNFSDSSEIQLQSADGIYRLGIDSLTNKMLVAMKNGGRYATLTFRSINHGTCCLELIAGLKPVSIEGARFFDADKPPA